MLPDGISLEAPAGSARFRSESRRVARYAEICGTPALPYLFFEAIFSMARLDRPV